MAADERLSIWPDKQAAPVMGRAQSEVKLGNDIINYDRRMQSLMSTAWFYNTGGS